MGRRWWTWNRRRCPKVLFFSTFFLVFLLTFRSLSISQHALTLDDAIVTATATATATATISAASTTTTSGKSDTTATTTTTTTTTATVTTHTTNHNITNNIHISVFVDMRAGWKDWGFSFIEANQLQLYGRYTYSIHWIDFHHKANDLQQFAKVSPYCVLMSNPKGLQEIRQTLAPHCRTWIVNDEYCQHAGDVRHYYYKQQQQPNSSSSTFTDTNFFVPLGPRFDFYHANLQAGYDTFRSTLSNHSNTPTIPTIPTTPNQTILPTSQRPYRFNAIFSKSTSPSRKLLKELLNASDTIQNNPSSYFIRIPGKWRRQMGPWHVPSDQYVDVLAHSQFTLSPNGHNPECFRLYESMLMGSIPILVTTGDEEYTQHACANALEPLFSFRQDKSTGSKDKKDSMTSSSLPMLILDNWTQLESAVEEWIGRGPVFLDTMQQNLLDWHHAFMTERVQRLEDLIVEGGGGH